MSNKRALLLDIEGVDTALVSHTGIVGTWASSSLAGLSEIPQGQTLSIDIDQWEPDAGGTMLASRDLSSLMLHRTQAPKSSVSVDESAGSTTIEIDDTSDFPSSGTLWIGQQAISYIGKTATQLQALTWGALGTEQYDVLAGAVAYGFSPMLKGRRCALYWVDRVTLVKVLRFKGYIDKISFENGQTLLSIISEIKSITDASALRTDFAKGKLSVALPIGTIDLEIEMKDPDIPFSSYSLSTWGKGHLRIDDEIIEYSQSSINFPMIPKDTVEVVSLISSTRLQVLGRTNAPGRFQVGDAFDLENLGTGAIDGRATITFIARVPGTPDNWYFDFSKFSDSFTAALGDFVRGNYHAIIHKIFIKRGMFGTAPAHHDVGATVEEYRCIEGDQLDILFWFLFSRTGDGTNGPRSGKYDILPLGWGLGLPSSYVDVDSFEVILARTRTDFRRYFFRGPVDLIQFLSQMGIATNTMMPFGEDATLRATLIEDLYPDTSTVHTIDTSTLHRESIPTPEWAMDRLKNIWVIRQDYDLEENHHRTTTIKVRESTDLYGDMPYAPLEDKGMQSIRSDAQIKNIALGNLMLRAFPLMQLTLDIRFEENLVLRPGDLVSVDLPYISDGEGGQGFLGVCIVSEVAPNEPEGKIGLVLIEHAGTSRVGLIAPAAVVESVASDELTVLAKSASHFADAAEDVTYFLEGDPIAIWDVSSFGTGSVKVHQTTIDNIDDVTRVITITSLPGTWTIAPDDLVRFDNYTAMAGGPTAGDRIDKYVSIATGTPPTLDGVDPFLWGA